MFTTKRATTNSIFKKIFLISKNFFQKIGGRNTHYGFAATPNNTNPYISKKDPKIKILFYKKILKKNF